MEEALAKFAGDLATVLRAFGPALVFALVLAALLGPRGRG